LEVRTQKTEIRGLKKSSLASVDLLSSGKALGFGLNKILGEFMVLNKPSFWRSKATGVIYFFTAEAQRTQRKSGKSQRSVFCRIKELVPDH